MQGEEATTTIAATIAPADDGKTHGLADDVRWYASDGLWWYHKSDDDG
jgi:hypothetical protein